MKSRLIILSSALLAAASVFHTSADNEFDKGSKKASLTIGVGTIPYKYNSKATFDQHFGMEWGVAKVTDKFTIGLGFDINNSYGATLQTKVAGEYDYKYQKHTYGWIYDYTTKKKKDINETRDVRRKGYGTADADLSREDANAMFTAAIHYSPMSHLDTYAKIGLGVGVMNYIYSNYQNLDGFGEEDVNRKSGDGKIRETTDRYKYRDLDHVTWSNTPSRVCASMAVYVGATYMINENWGVDGQFGLISGNLKTGKKGYIGSYGIFALGASYHF